VIFLVSTKENVVHSPNPYLSCFVIQCARICFKRFWCHFAVSFSLVYFVAVAVLFQMKVSLDMTFIDDVVDNCLFDAVLFSSGCFTVY